MWITEFGMVKFAKQLQYAKAPSAMRVTESEMVKLTKERQPLKVLCPMWMTEFGMVKFVRELQS